MMDRAAYLFLECFGRKPSFSPKAAGGFFFRVICTKPIDDMFVLSSSPSIKQYLNKFIAHG